MSRTVVNLIIDLFAGCLFLAMIATGYILHFPLPPRTNKTLMLWGMTRHTWGTVHFWISLGLLATLLVHVVLHWEWIVTVVGRRLHLPSRLPLFRTGLAVVLVLALAGGLFAWIVHLNVNPIVAHSSDGRRREKEPPADVGNQKSVGVEGKAQFGFARDVHRILEKRCLSCHGPSRQLGGFRVDRRADFFDADRTSLVVIPGKSGESSLIDIVSGRQKNPRLAAIHKLSEDEVAVLKAWIDAGADWPAVPSP